IVECDRHPSSGCVCTTADEIDAINRRLGHDRYCPKRETAPEGAVLLLLDLGHHQLRGFAGLETEDYP
ncbi:MAG TPA: hypothetical protein VIR01_16170, partial [Pyrinomonadaceae bacterium]